MGFFSKIGEVFRRGLDDIIQSGDDDLSMSSPQDDEVSLGGSGLRYKGSINNIGKCVRIGLATAGIVFIGYQGYRGIKGLHNYRNNRKTAQEEIDRIKTEKDAKIEIINAQADADIRVAEAKAAAKNKGYQNRGGCDIPSCEGPCSSTNRDNQITGDPWYNWFKNNFFMPTEMPNLLFDIIMSVSERHQDAMLLQALSMFGALCFSKVRAKYHHKMHSPSLQVVIEGKSGMGKSAFHAIYELLFERMIERDNNKLDVTKNDGSKKQIIQNMGITVTKAKFIETMAGNNGVHMYIFDPEISNATRALKKSNYLTYDDLRNAFDNTPVYKNNMVKNAVAGHFKIYLNYTFTGTKDLCDNFIENELEDGTIQRICWAYLPPKGRDNEPYLTLPSETRIDEMRDQIDDYCERYCYTTDALGNDLAVNEYVIDLDYAISSLENWVKKQESLADKEDNPARRECCNRFADMAFRAAMIIHMLYLDDTSIAEDDKRKNICLLAIYVADLCMERFLCKFQEELNKKSRESDQAELVTPAGITTNKSLDYEVLSRWDAGEHNQSNIARDIQDKFPDIKFDTLKVYIGRILRENNRL